MSGGAKSYLRSGGRVSGRGSHQPDREIVKYIKHMKNTFGLAVLLAALGWGQGFSQAAEVIPVLNIGTQSLTNVEVLEVSQTHLFVRVGSAMVTVNLSDVDPALQKRFGYDPVKAAAIQAAPENNVPAVSAGETRSTKPVYELSLTNKTAPAEWMEKDFAIGKNGALSLVLPKFWKETIQKSTLGEISSISVRIQPEYGSNFIFLVSTVPAKNCLNRLGGKSLLELAAQPYVAGSEEHEVRIQELSGAEGDGAFFTLSDKAMDQGPQKNGKHKYQSQGYVKVSDFTLSFVVLYDYADSMDLRAALKVIQTARFKTREMMSASDLARTN